MRDVCYDIVNFTVKANLLLDKYFFYNIQTYKYITPVFPKGQDIKQSFSFININVKKYTIGFISLKFISVWYALPTALRNSRVVIYVYHNVF